LINFVEGGLENKSVEDVMQESPPIINKNAKVSVIVSLLRFYPIVLVQEKGNLCGVITKADILRSLSL